MIGGRAEKDIDAIIPRYTFSDMSEEMKDFAEETAKIAFSTLI
jgi:hypothetical protein